MKKILCVALVLAMCMTLGVSLTACGHEHEWGTEWISDEISHWHTCTSEGCTEVGDKAEHSWDVGEITTKPSATADGVKTFKCTVCNKAKIEPVKSKTDVTATEWENALALKSENFAWTMKLVADGGVYKMEIKQVVKRNGDKLQSTSVTTILIPETPIEQTENIYYAKEGDKYYFYKSVGEVVEKSELNEADYLDNMEGGLDEIFKLEDFQYADGAYTAAQITVGEGEDVTKYINVTIKFVDGQLVLLNYTQVEDGGFTVMESTVEYGNVPEILLPTVTVE